MKHKKMRLFLLLGILGSIGMVGYKVVENMWLMKAAQLRNNPLDALDYIPEAALRVKEFHRTKVEDGRKVWEVSGDEAHYLKADREAVIKKPKVVFYNKKGETLEARADQARLFFAERDIDRLALQGDIEVSFEGFVFNTEEILYTSENNSVVSSGKVSLKADGLELEGVGMEMDLTSEKIRFLQNVKTRIEPEKLEKRRSRAQKENV